MYLAIRTAAAALRAGHSVDEAIHEAKTTGGFVGVMRTNLMSMLDGIGLHSALGLTTYAQLYSDRTDPASNGLAAGSVASGVNGSLTGHTSCSLRWRARRIWRHGRRARRP
jgi:hypothetical protein